MNTCAHSMVAAEPYASACELLASIRQVLRRVERAALAPAFRETVARAHDEIAALCGERDVVPRQRPLASSLLRATDGQHRVRVARTWQTGCTVIASQWMKEGEIVHLRVDSDDARTAEHTCRIQRCRHSQREEDDPSVPAYFLTLDCLYSTPLTSGDAS